MPQGSTKKLPTLRKAKKEATEKKKKIQKKSTKASLVHKVRNF